MPLLNTIFCGIFIFMSIEVPPYEATANAVISQIETNLHALTPGEREYAQARIAQHFGEIVLPRYAIAEDDYDLTIAALAQLGITGTRQRPIPHFEELSAEM